MRYRKKRIPSRFALLVLGCCVAASCASLFGITRNYRSDGLAALDVRVTGPPACGACAQVAPSITAGIQRATVTIRGPADAARPDSLSMLTDVHGQALFDGVKAGSYTMEIEPPPGFQIPAARRLMLSANSKRNIKIKLGGVVDIPVTVSRPGRR